MTKSALGNFVPHKKKIKPSAVVITIVLHLAVLFAIAVALFPFYVLIVNSIKSYGEGLYFVWWPAKPSLDAYKFVLFDQQIRIDYELSIMRGLWNSFKIAVPSVTIGTLVAAMSAYTFVKRDFPGKNVIFSILMFSMMIPSTVTMISMYLIYAKVGWVNTPLPLMIPGMFGTVTLLFALRQYMYGIPTELVDSGRIDGANHFYIFWRIILPLASPVLVAQWLLGFMASYNQYQEPLLYLIDPSQYTIQLVLPNFSQAVGLADAPKAAAVSILAMLPMFILYASSQKFFAKGIMTGALKG